jgi:hypothetical protein
MYQSDPNKYAELARLMTQHEDVMLRLSAEPERGTHRNSSYSAPLYQVPPDGFSSISQARTWQGGRTRVLNFGGVEDPSSAVNGGPTGASDHPEFRIFDSSLNIGVMQAQIKLAVAMTHAAARNADLGGTRRTKEVAGTHAARAKARGRRRMTAEDIAEDSATFRSLIDTLYRRKEDKDQIVALFAQNKWLARPQQVLTEVPRGFTPLPRP